MAQFQRAAVIWVEGRGLRRGIMAEVHLLETKKRSQLFIYFFPGFKNRWFLIGRAEVSVNWVGSLLVAPVQWQQWNWGRVWATVQFAFFRWCANRRIAACRHSCTGTESGCRPSDKCETQDKLHAWHVVKIWGCFSPPILWAFIRFTGHSACNFIKFNVQTKITVKLVITWFMAYLHLFKRATLVVIH